MDFNIEIRRKQLENLDQFISSSKDRVESILEYLGWSAQKITENTKEMVKCLVNPQHRIAAATASTHMQSCAWHKESYAANDVPLSEPNFIPGSSLIIDDLTKVNVLNSALAQNPMMKTAVQFEICFRQCTQFLILKKSKSKGWRPNEPVPKTSNRLLATFTPDERLALYEFSAASTKGPPEVPEFNLNEPKTEKKHDLTPAEREKLERDAKRRRIKHKTKSVHTNRKSMTEILRELIEYQMEMYEDWLNDDGTTKSDKDEAKEDEEAVEQSSNPGSASPRSSRSQNSYESRHRARYRSRSRDRRYRSRSRSRKRDDYRHKSREYSSRRRYDDNREDRDRSFDSRETRDRNDHRDRSYDSRDRGDSRRNRSRDYRSDRSRNRSER